MSIIEKIGQKTNLEMSLRWKSNERSECDMYLYDDIATYIVGQPEENILHALSGLEKQIVYGVFTNSIKDDRRTYMWQLVVSRKTEKIDLAVRHYDYGGVTLLPKDDFVHVIVEKSWLTEGIENEKEQCRIIVSSGGRIRYFYTDEGFRAGCLCINERKIILPARIEQQIAALVYDWVYEKAEDDQSYYLATRYVEDSTEFTVGEETDFNRPDEVPFCVHDSINTIKVGRAKNLAIALNKYFREHRLTAYVTNQHWCDDRVDQMNICICDSERVGFRIDSSDGIHCEGESLVLVVSVVSDMKKMAGSDKYEILDKEYKQLVEPKSVKMVWGHCEFSDEDVQIIIEKLDEILKKE